MKINPDSHATVLVVVGTRPEAIKMTPVVSALRETKNIRPLLVFTGQHDSLISQTMQGMTFDPDISLDLMSPDQNLYELTAKCLLGLREVVQSHKPDCLLVQGDTTTAFTGSMVAFLEGVPLGHVEAGLRSRNNKEPFPEEGYRKMIDAITDLYFAPTSVSAQNLKHEGIPDQKIFITGNTVVDAIHTILPHNSTAQNSKLASILASAPSKLVLLTAHRRESFGQPLRDIFQAVQHLTELDSELEIIYPVHPNPNVSENLGQLIGNDRIHLLDPLSYEDLLLTLQNVELVLTDSGGIQEEAPSFGVHTLIMRNNTEREEGITAGVATLVGTNAATIVSASLEKLENCKFQMQSPDIPSNPYGDGKASERIADILESVIIGNPRTTEDWMGP
ncbi:MAG: UDP-N-acetylglucosamine 2-epimerase (non-hydrolyzing) [Longimicrobiales bacterium]|nr:UDP-N-acetylglucosamine 2-epimerase (non-hydrolyzing) [Longimicrobiales bacterium]